MIAFGVGEILGCFFIGFIVDKLGSRKASIFNVGICFIMTVLSLAYIIIFDWDIYLACAMCFMWGIEDSATNTHC